jgi:hypothetical protein
MRIRFLTYFLVSAPLARRGRTPSYLLWPGPVSAWRRRICIRLDENPVSIVHAGAVCAAVTPIIQPLRAIFQSPLGRRHARAFGKIEGKMISRIVT